MRNEKIIVNNIDWSFLQCKKNLKIIYEDCNLFLVYKPKGLLSQSTKDEKIETIENKARAYLFFKKEFTPNTKDVFVPSLCNRLDFNTDGLILIAKNKETLTFINKKIADREIRKFYLASVYEKPKKESAILTGWLQKDKAINKAKVLDKEIPNSLYVELHYKQIEKRGKYYNLEIELITGRSHQIRAQLAKEGLNIVGDNLYNKKSKSNASIQALTAYKILFDFKICPNKYAYLNKKTIVCQ